MPAAPPQPHCALPCRAHRVCRSPPGGDPRPGCGCLGSGVRCSARRASKGICCLEGVLSSMGRPSAAAGGAGQGGAGRASAASAPGGGLPAGLRRRRLQAPAAKAATLKNKAAEDPLAAAAAPCGPCPPWEAHAHAHTTSHTQPPHPRRKAPTVHLRGRAEGRAGGEAARQPGRQHTAQRGLHEGRGACRLVRGPWLLLGSLS